MSVEEESEQQRDGAERMARNLHADIKAHLGSSRKLSGIRSGSAGEDLWIRDGQSEVRPSPRERLTRGCCLLVSVTGTVWS